MKTHIPIQQKNIANHTSHNTTALRQRDSQKWLGLDLAARFGAVSTLMPGILMLILVGWMSASNASAQYAGRWTSANETQGYNFSHPEKDIYLDITINTSGVINGQWRPYVVYFTMDVAGFPYQYLRASSSSSGTVSGSMGSGSITLEGLGSASFSYSSSDSTTLIFTFSGIANLHQSKIVQAAAPVATGSLTVTLQPSTATDAGAQWRRTGTSLWRSSGATETDVAVGDYSVEFSPLDGWVSPSAISVIVRENQTASASGTYVKALPPTLAPIAGNHGSGAGSGNFIVTTVNGASWSASSSSSWLHTSSSGTGNGTVYYTVDANPNAAFRSGTITVGGQTFTITQGPAGFAWHNVFGWIFNAGSGWYHHNGFGWMWFSSGQWIWSGSLQGWVATMDSTSRTLWSPQFRWLTPSESDPYRADTTAIGAIYLGQYNGSAITEGWVVSDRFGYVWAAGDGKWFYSNTYGWLGVTPEGGIWCVSQGKFL